MTVPDPASPATPAAGSGSRRVLIAGGGVAGLEAALALRAHAPDLLDVTLVAGDPYLVYRPLAVGVPFGGASSVRVDLATVADERGFALVEDRVTGVELAENALVTKAG